MNETTPTTAKKIDAVRKMRKRTTMVSTQMDGVSDISSSKIIIIIFLVCWKIIPCVFFSILVAVVFLYFTCHAECRTLLFFFCFIHPSAHHFPRSWFGCTRCTVTVRPQPLLLSTIVISLLIKRSFLSVSLMFKFCAYKCAHRIHFILINNGRLS